MTNPDEEARRAAEWEARLAADPTEARYQAMEHFARLLGLLFVEARKADPNRAQKWANATLLELQLRVTPTPGRPQ